ncbi:hypothetical protein KKC00_00335 [Patescibacteria group bacterium]|nr:hypothetical protein [Patescibacteria group bacterium]
MEIKDFFFWVEPLEKIFWTSFGWVILLAIIFAVPVLRVWWWLFVPIILMYRLQSLYLWWIAWDFWYPKNKWVMLELVPPKEVLAPLSAMEDVFSTVWSVVDKANWREIWCEGELPLCPYWLSWEIASIEGKIHFYVRCLEEHRHVVESVLYSHYPELEITQTSDYTKNVPQNLPNEEWDIYGEDYILGRDYGYPIKTYTKFFEPQGERISQEEKRVDPIISLLEDMGRVGPGEQVWFQMITSPVLDEDIPWRAEAKKLINKLSRRPEKKMKSFAEYIYEVVSAAIFGAFSPDKEGEEKSISLAQSEGGEKEMIITPGEREVLTAIEEKIKKLAYKTNIRGLYLAKRENFKGPHGKIVRAYFTHFSATNLNHFRFWGKTRTKVHFIWRDRRKTLRGKKLFMNYVQRFPPMFPVLVDEGNPIFNTEELTTMFHFPTRLSGISAPTVVRVEAKKGGPPPDLPVEE